MPVLSKWLHSCRFAVEVAVTASCAGWVTKDVCSGEVFATLKARNERGDRLGTVM